MSRTCFLPRKNNPPTALSWVAGTCSGALDKKRNCVSGIVGTRCQWGRPDDTTARCPQRPDGARRPVLETGGPRLPTHRHARSSPPHIAIARLAPHHSPRKSLLTQSPASADRCTRVPPSNAAWNVAASADRLPLLLRGFVDTLRSPRPFYVVIVYQGTVSRFCGRFTARFVRPRSSRPDQQPIERPRTGPIVNDCK